MTTIELQQLKQKINERIKSNISSLSKIVVYVKIPTTKEKITWPQIMLLKEEYKVLGWALDFIEEENTLTLTKNTLSFGYEDSPPPKK